MKSLTIVLLFLTVTLSYSQTGRIRGYVFSKKEGKGLSYAKLSLDTLKAEVYADSDGFFKIDSIPVGSYALRIVETGFPDTVLNDIKISANSVVNLNIEFPASCPFKVGIKVCPDCQKSDKVIRVVYGEAGIEMIEQAKRGEIRLGGCVITECDPYWYCKRDKREF